MKQAYLRSMAGIDDMIYNRQRDLMMLKYWYRNPITQRRAIDGFYQKGIKLFAEIKKLQAIRSELYLIVTYNL